MKIKVTKEDIMSGVRECANLCPIAIAVHRHTMLDGVEVFSDMVHFIIPGPDHEPDEANLPRSARRFVKRFDDGEVVHPCVFYIKDLPFNAHHQDEKLPSVGKPFKSK